MSSTFPAVSRRHLLSGAGLLALLAVAAPACGSTPAPPKVDDLQSQQQLALSDSALAAAAAAALAGAGSGGMAPALTEVAAQRGEHARALATEIARAAGKSEPTPTEAVEPPGTTAATAPAPTVSDVITALRAAADSAGQLATETSGYRAGLLASIAAACTAAHTVALVAP